MRKRWEGGRKERASGIAKNRQEKRKRGMWRRETGKEEGKRGYMRGEYDAECCINNVVEALQ